MNCVNEDNIKYNDRWGATATMNKTDMITFGGYSYNIGLMNDMWILKENGDINNIKYESVYNPTPRMFSNIEYSDDVLYLSNGLDDVEHKFRYSCGLADIWRFDFQDCTWTLLNDMTEKCEYTEDINPKSKVNKFDIYFGILLGFVSFFFISFVIFIIKDKKELKRLSSYAEHNENSNL